MTSTNSTIDARPRLAIYGGAFDPPTLAHAAVASRLVRAGFARVLVMPCFGHTFGKTLAPASDRLTLAVETFSHLPEVRVSSFEIDLGLNGSTYEMVNKLSLLPECATHRVFMAIGSDEANAFHRWRRSEELMRLIPFVVVMRAGHPLDENGRWALTAPHLVLPLNQSSREVSSTVIRAQIASGHLAQARRHLSSRVFAYIKARRLYARPTALSFVPPPLHPALS
ncbi:MAG: hypothetical protein ABIZ04_04810 [Opitutus sp.]